ncbi:MAG: TolC family protein [Candidatus Eisenbacteria bacterium]|nr:TolC family protein [Candidatus Eisenbacteria bacterium]
MASASDANPDSALARTLAGIPGSPITLDQAVALALQHATQAREAGAGLDAARGALRRERGVFDPELYASAQKSHDERPSASPFLGSAGVQSDESRVAGGARMRTRLGTELDLSLGTVRLESNPSFSSLNPGYTTVGALTFTQPLLKGFGPSARKRLASAEHGMLAAEALYDDATLAVRSQVEQVYWDLYAAGRDLAVQQLSRNRAAAFLKEAELRARAGLAGPVEPANARVFLAEQEQAVLDREERLDQVSDQLGSLMGRRPEGGSRFRPATEPPGDFTVEPEDTLVARALRDNGVVRAARQSEESARALARGARWDALPRLDVFGTLAANGVAGTGHDIIFGADTLHNSATGGFGDTWDQVRKRQYPAWVAGVRVSVPIGFRQDGGERDRLRSEAERARQQRLAAERALEERVRAASRELRHATRRLEAARGGAEASTEQVRIGSLEYQAGRTTAFEIVRLRADLAAAQQRYSQALVRAAKAVAELRRLTGAGFPAATHP